MNESSELHEPVAAEPDRPELKLARRFIVAVAIFVAASLVGLHRWLDTQVNPSADIAAETER